MSADLKRRWLFHIEDSDGDDHYIDADGKAFHAEEFYVGTMAEAAAEAGRRSDLWESLPGNGWPMKVTCESHGKAGE